MTYLYLALAGFGAWIVSTVGGGGGALILVPVISFLVGVSAVAPVVTLATMIAEPTRIYLFSKSIDWTIVRWYLPGGSFSTAWRPAWVPCRRTGSESDFSGRRARSAFAGWCSR